MTEVVTAASQAAGAGAREAHPSFEVCDSEFAAALGPAPRLALVAETNAHEGPVYIPGEDVLYFTTLPGRVDVPAPGTPCAYIKRLALDGLNFPVDPSRMSIVSARVTMPNGMALGRDGRLVVCEQGTRAEHARISRVDPTAGEAETVVDAWGGLRLNSPNDVVIRSDGTIWFTDPSYGYLQGFRPEPQIGDYVYRYDPGSGRLSVAADCFDKPNGLAFSPDEQTLYITDSGANQEPGSYHVQRPHRIVAFDVHDSSHLGPAACSRSRLPDSRTASRWTGSAASTRPRPPGSRCSARPGISSARSTCPGRSTSPSAGRAARSCSSPRTRRSGPLS